MPPPCFARLSARRSPTSVIRKRERLRRLASYLIAVAEHVADLGSGAPWRRVVLRPLTQTASESRPSSGHGVAVDAMDELLGIAGVAVGLAGFAGVAAAFLLDRDYQRDDQLRFVALLFGTLSVTFLSFVPLLLGRAGLATAAAWKWSSVVALLVSAAGLQIGLTLLREAGAFEKKPPRWVFIPQWILFISGPVAHGLNLAGVLRGPGPTLYLAGLLAWLAAGALLFAIIVLLRRPAPSGNEKPATGAPAVPADGDSRSAKLNG